MYPSIEQQNEEEKIELFQSSQPPPFVNTRKIRYVENQIADKALVSSSLRMGRTVLRNKESVPPYAKAYGMACGFNAYRTPADIRPVSSGFPITSIPSENHQFRAVTYPEEAVDHGLNDFAATEPQNTAFFQASTHPKYLIPAGLEPGDPQDLFVVTHATRVQTAAGLPQTALQTFERPTKTIPSTLEPVGLSTTVVSRGGFADSAVDQCLNRPLRLSPYGNVFKPISKLEDGIYQGCKPEGSIVPSFIINSLGMKAGGIEKSEFPLSTQHPSASVAEIPNFSESQRNIDDGQVRTSWKLQGEQTLKTYNSSQRGEEGQGQIPTLNDVRLAGQAQKDLIDQNNQNLNVQKSDELQHSIVGPLKSQGLFESQFAGMSSPSSSPVSATRQSLVSSSSWNKNNVSSQRSQVALQPQQSMRSNTTMSASSSRSQLDQLSLDKPFLARMSHLRNDWFEPVFDGIQHIHPNTDIGPHPERESLSKTLRELQEFQNYQQNKQEVETTSITSVPGQSQHPPIQIQPPQNAQSTGNQQQQTQNQTIVQSSYLKADEQHELTEEEKQILLRRQQMKQQILKRTPRRDTRVHVRSDGLIVGPGAFIDEKVAAINSIETLLTNLRSAANDLSYDVEREIFDDNNSRTSNETSRRQRSEYNQMNYDGDDSQGKGGGVPHWVKKGLNNSVVSDEDQRPPLDLLRPQSNSPWLKQSVNDTQQWSTWRKRGKDTTFLLDTEPFIPLPRIQQISPNHSPPLLFEQTIQPEMLFSKFSRNSLGMRTSFQQQVDRYEAIAAEIDELRQTLEQSSSQQGNDKEKAKRELLYHSYQGLIEELRKMNEYLTFRMQRTTKGKTKTNTKTNRNKSNRSVVYSSPVISAIPTMQRQNSNWYELKGDAFTVAHKEFLLQLKDEERKILEKKGYYDELARLQQ